MGYSSDHGIYLESFMIITTHQKPLAKTMFFDFNYLLKQLKQTHCKCKIYLTELLLRNMNFRLLDLFQLNEFNLNPRENILKYQQILCHYHIVFSFFIIFKQLFHYYFQFQQEILLLLVFLIFGSISVSRSHNFILETNLSCLHFTNCLMLFDFNFC